MPLQEIAPPPELAALLATYFQWGGVVEYAPFGPVAPSPGEAGHRDAVRGFLPFLSRDSHHIWDGAPERAQGQLIPVSEFLGIAQDGDGRPVLPSAPEQVKPYEAWWRNRESHGFAYAYAFFDTPHGWGPPLIPLPYSRKGRREAEEQNRRQWWDGRHNLFRDLTPPCSPTIGAGWKSSLGLRTGRRTSTPATNGGARSCGPSTCPPANGSWSSPPRPRTDPSPDPSP